MIYLFAYQRENKKLNESFRLTIILWKLHYYTVHWKRFIPKRISVLISNRFNPKVLLIFKTFKVKNYFLLKPRTPKALCSNVIYKFIGTGNTNMTYIGMSSRHLITRVREHLNFKSIQESAVKKSYFVM